MKKLDTSKTTTNLKNTFYVDKEMQDTMNEYYQIKRNLISFLKRTISDKCMGMYELNQKLAIARGNGFIFNQINNFKIKIYSNLSHINIHYHLKLGLPPLHTQFFIKISQNRDYIQTFCNDRNIPFHFACRQWYSYNNPQC